MGLIYRATITGLYHGQTIQNVVHFTDKTTQGGTPPEPKLIAQDMVANWLPNERLLHQDNFMWSSVECSVIRNPAPPPAHIEPVFIQGFGGVTQSHSVSAFKIRWHTNRGGKRGRGKYYIGGIAWNLLDGNAVIGATGRDRLTAFCAAIESRYMAFDVGPVPFQMILVHKDANDPPDFITTCSFYPELGVQRRRNKFVGL